MSEYNNEQIERDGLSLQDAFDQIAKEHDLGPEYKAITSDPASRKDNEKIIVGKVFEESQKTNGTSFAITIWSAEIEAKALAERRKTIEGIFKRSVISKLASGEFIVFGKPENRYTPYALISASTVRDMHIKSWGKSTLVERGQPVLHDVRLFEKNKLPAPIDAAPPAVPAISPANSEFRTSSLSNKMSIDACIMDHYENNKSDFDQVNKCENTQVWLAKKIADKYNLSADSVGRSLRDRTKSPLFT